MTARCVGVFTALFVTPTAGLTQTVTNTWPSIIREASANPLAIVALIILTLGLVSILFFHRVDVKYRFVVFSLLIIGAGLLVYATVSLPLQTKNPETATSTTNSTSQNPASQGRGTEQRGATNDKKTEDKSEAKLAKPDRTPKAAVASTGEVVPKPPGSLPPQQEISLATSQTEWVEGEFGNQPFQVAGGTPPYTWVALGPPIPGLNINSQTGILSGTPNSAGDYTVLLQVGDARSAYSKAQSFQLHILPKAVPSAYSGTLASQATGPIKNAHMVLVGTACTDETDDKGNFDFRSCLASQQLPDPRIQVTLMGAPKPCPTSLKLESPPHFIRLTLGNDCEPQPPGRQLMAVNVIIDHTSSVSNNIMHTFGEQDILDHLKSTCLTKSRGFDTTSNSPAATLHICYGCRKNPGFLSLRILDSHGNEIDADSIAEQEFAGKKYDALDSFCADKVAADDLLPKAVKK